MKMTASRATIAALALCAASSFVPAGAQTTGTRSTPCDPATPNNAACLQWSAVTEREDGSTYPTGTTVTYRVEKQTGSTWTSLGTVTQTRFLASNLAYGEHVFRVFAIVNSLTSDASNTSSRRIDEPRPRAPVLTIAVVIGMDHAPVYRLTKAGKRDERYRDACGYIPVGAACDEKTVFRFRDATFKRVNPDDVKEWNVTCGENVAAPCAQRS